MHSPFRDAIRPSPSRDIPCVLRKPKVNLPFLVQRGVTSWFNCRIVQVFLALKEGTPKFLNASGPFGHQLPLDPAPHPRKTAALR